MIKRTFVVILWLIFGLAAFADFKAGVAVRVVTPDPLLPVSGGVGPSHPADKALGDLNVRAIVFDDGDTRIAIVSADFLGFPAVLGDKVRQQVDSIPPKNILIGATHTHSAPDMYGLPVQDGKPGIDLKYAEWVCQRAAEAVNEAVENLQPCSLKIATGDAKGKIAYNYYAPQLYDPRCDVIQCIGTDGKPFATLVNYAIHPEVLGPDRGVVSPDLIGPLYQHIEKMGGGTAIFMNGAQGGMVTADVRGADGKDVQTWDECKRIGNLLAEEAMRIVKDAPVQENPGLFCASIPITFAMDSPMLQMLVINAALDYPLNADGSVTTQVNVVNLGDAQMLTIPGEALPNIGYYLKRNMHGEHNMLLGLTNDAFGYILTKVDFNSFKRYEYVSRTSLGEMTGETLIEQALKFVDRCPRPKTE